MDLPIMWIALIAGLVFGILGLTKKGKSKKTGKTFIVIGAIGLVFALASYMGWAGIPQVYPFAFAVAPGAEPTGQITPSGICAVEDTTVTLSSINPYTQAATGGSHRYSINGAPALTVSNAGTFTASPVDKLNVLWTNATSSGATNYFSAVDNVVVPCAGTKTFSKELYSNGTVTIQVYNEEGNLISTTGENETLAAGDTITLDAKLKGTYQKAVPHGAVMIAEYNSTCIDDVIVNFGGSEVNVPSVYSIQKGKEGKAKAYSIPAFFSNEIITGSVYIDADDAISADYFSAGDINLTLMYNDYFVNSDTGLIEGPAIENEDDELTFPQQNTFIINVDI